jgi:hypothetical protein
MQIDPTKLRVLVGRAKALLGGHYEKLEARRKKGAKDPHRLVVLIARAEEMTAELEQGRGFDLTGEYAVTLSELDAMVPLLEEAATIPGFQNGHIAKTTDYVHTAVMLAARAFLLGIASAKSVTFVPRANSPTPDMHVVGDDAEVNIEVYTPQRLCHPADPTLSEDEAAEIVAAAFRRKKGQLTTGDTIMLIGGFGCNTTSIDRLKSATEDRLAPGNRRPHMAALALYVIASWTRFGGEPDALQVEGVSAGAHTGLVLNPGYEGDLQLRPLADLPPGSSSARLVPNLAKPGTYFLATKAEV